VKTGDLANFGVGIDASGAPEGARVFDAATNQIVGSSAKAQRGIMQMESAMDSALRQMGQMGAVGQTSLGGLADAHVRAGQAAERHHININRLERTFESFAARIFGVNEILGVTAAAGSNFFAGSTWTVGILGGLALVALAWEKITEKSREAAKEQKKLLDALHEHRLEEDMGPGGKIAGGVRLATDSLEILREKMHRINEVAKANPSLLQPELERRAVIKQYIELSKDVASGESHITRIVEDEARKREEAHVQELAALVQAHHATAANYAEIRKIIARDTEEMIRVATHGGDPARVAQLAGDRERLTAALRAENDEREREIKLRQEAEQKFANDLEKTTERTIEIAAEADAMRASDQALRDGTTTRKQYEADLWREHELNEALKIDNVGQRQARIDAINTLYDAKVAHEELVTALEKEEAEQKRAASEITQLWKNMWRDLQHAGTNFFEQLFAGGMNSMQALVDGIRHLFARLLAELTMMKIGRAMTTGAFAGMFGTASDASFIARHSGGSGDSGMLGGLGAQIAKSMLGGGVAGGLLGYGVGSTTTDRGMGAFGGAAAGAVSGAMVGGALGAIAGGLVGFVGGLLGAGKAARDAAEDMRIMREQFQIHMTAIRLEINGTELQRALADNAAQFVALREEAKKAYPEVYAFGFSLNQLTGTTSEQAAALWQLNALEVRRRVQLLQEHAEKEQQLQEDLQVRLLRAQGHAEEADAMAFALGQQREYAEAVKAGHDALNLAALAEVQRVEKINFSMAKLQEKADALDRTIGGLKDFRNQLLLSPDTGFSPTEQLAEARRQYQQLLASAQAGDQDAASRIPTAAQSYLDFARQLYASGPEFQKTFQSVLEDTAAVIHRFETERSLIEQQLDVLKAIRDNTREQADGITDLVHTGWGIFGGGHGISTGGGIGGPPPPPPLTYPGGGSSNTDVVDGIATTNEELHATVQALSVGFLRLSDQLAQLKQSVEDGSTATRRAIEGIAAGGRQLFS
jgi:hypothetical protein